MEVKQALEELMAIPEQKSPIASVYLDTSRIDLHQRHAIQVFVHDHVRAILKTAGPRFDEFKETLQPIEDYVAALVRQRVDEWASGLAIFGSATMEQYRVVKTRLPFQPMQFFFESRPRLLPLIKTAALLPPLLVAAVDSEGGYLFEASGGVVDVQAKMQMAFPGRHGRGGWRQRRNERHIERILDRNLEATAKPLVRMSDLIPNGLIVLVGQEQILDAFERFLPQRIMERVVGRIPQRPIVEEGKLRDDLFARAWEKAQQTLDRRILAARNVAVSESARGQQAIGVAGAKQVLLALNESRVYQLVLDPRWSAQGWLCSKCEAIGEGTVSSCQFCGSKVLAVDLVEEIAKRAWRDETELSFLPKDETLPQGIGLVGLLRPRRTEAWVPTLGEAAPTE
jgi:hypothetical protein